MLPIAVNEMLSKSKTTLERRKAIDQYEEGFQVDWGEDWAIIVFVPFMICKLRDL